MLEALYSGVGNTASSNIQNKVLGKKQLRIFWRSKMVFMWRLRAFHYSSRKMFSIRPWLRKIILSPGSWVTALGPKEAVRCFKSKRKEVQVPWFNILRTLTGWLRIFLDISPGLHFLPQLSLPYLSLRPLSRVLLSCQTFANEGKYRCPRLDPARLSSKVMDGQVWVNTLEFSLAEFEIKRKILF